MGLAFSSAVVATTPTALALVKAAAPTVASAALAAIARRGSISPDSPSVPSSPTNTNTTATTVVIEVQVKGALLASVSEEVERAATSTPSDTHIVAPTTVTAPASTLTTPEAEKKMEADVQPVESTEKKCIPDCLHLFVSDLAGSDSQGNGSLESPFQSLERTLNEISKRGYNTSAKITILDQVQLPVQTLNTCVSGKGTQDRPLVLSTTCQSSSSVVPL